MKFFKRLKYFAVGFSLGILFVYFLFKDRDFKWDWLPGNRVSNFILDHPIKIDESRLGKIIDKEETQGMINNSSSDLFGNIKVTGQLTTTTQSNWLKDSSKGRINSHSDTKNKNYGSLQDTTNYNLLVTDNIVGHIYVILLFKNKN